MKTLVIGTCATKNYTYALPALLRAISRNVYKMRRSLGEELSVSLVLIGDEEVRKISNKEGRLLRGIEVRHIIHDWKEGENYKKEAQLVIAQMRSAMFDHARELDADWLWSLDSDVLPPDNALLCSLQMLSFDGSYYSIAFCPYPSQGGGSFMGGFGSPTETIYRDFNMDEREIPEEKLAEWSVLQGKIQKAKDGKEEDLGQLLEQEHEWRKEMEKICPPKHGGNIWKLISENGWRKRGWFDYAYPALGKGAVVPIDWCGFGCTLMDEKAIAAADFTGYGGTGTEDLFIIWRRWFPRGLRLCAIPHCPCDHVIRDAKAGVIHVMARHETNSDTEGHLRKSFLPFQQHTAGEPAAPDLKTFAK